MSFGGLPFGAFGLFAASLTMILVPIESAQAAPGLAKAVSPFHVRPGTESATRVRGRKAKPRAAGGSLWIFRNAANVVPNQQGKVVVFPFRSDDGNTVSTQVSQLLEARGLQVMTDVRPVDNVEHYRDVATHLALAAFVDGDVRGSDANTRVIERLRNGYTGRPMASATFTESRANLAREISDNLWKKLGSAVARACEDAGKPRKPSRHTLQINAGTPIETVPARSK